MIKKIFKITDMHCTSCALLIETELEDAGIKSRANYAKGVVEVEFDEKHTDTDKIIALINKAGYQVKQL